MKMKIATLTHPCVSGYHITSENCVHNMSSYPNKIYTTVKINDKCSIKMKVDTGANTCVLATDDLQRLGLSVEIQ